MDSDYKFNVLKNLLEADRSVRRFDQKREISAKGLERLVNLTRLCASGRNIQPLRYRVVYTPEECAKVFPALAWAGYYKDWDGPEEGERPSAYLVQCLDTELTSTCLCDDGLQLQTITLGATSLGLACCIIKSFNKGMLMDVLRLKERYMPLYVLALGYGVEKVKLVEMKSDGDYKYYRDSEGTQCVPKRNLSDLII